MYASVLLKSVSDQVAVEIWMYGVTALLSFLQCVSSQSYDNEQWQRNSGGTGLLQKPFLLPLIVCHPKQIGSRAVADSTEQRVRVQWNLVKRSPSKCLSSGTLRGALWKMFMLDHIYSKLVVSLNHKIVLLMKCPMPPTNISSINELMCPKLTDLREIQPKKQNPNIFLVFFGLPQSHCSKVNTGSTVHRHHI